MWVANYEDEERLLWGVVFYQRGSIVVYGIFLRNGGGGCREEEGKISNNWVHQQQIVVGSSGPLIKLFSKNVEPVLRYRYTYTYVTLGYMSTMSFVRCYLFESNMRIFLLHVECICSSCASSEGYLVYECNQRCCCSQTCQNRVLQNGVQVKLEIFKTEKKGWAVRAREAILRGSFVCEYIGEIIDEQEANNRCNRYDKESCRYFYEIDAHINDVSRLIDGPVPYVIDATNYGNISRFINHRCGIFLFFILKFFFWLYLIWSISGITLFVFHIICEHFQFEEKFTLFIFF
ncbi:histone-lysine N-methyltransferase, H3 lysine-36 specific-like [Olea europaea var. sylvestris]|uniref:histone-lysine N-methyltransferase, H3 lysine-36 specific-like n=1 Tax=Olea europaea var. sylvestris TaxID=158386 RepID=UPI000C1D4052|nr:histone-lysine N-methyltransferase, H3 lysine-36 specific-like [Olea europaea var. sylvestris]